MLGKCQNRLADAINFTLKVDSAVILHPKVAKLRYGAI